jgi:hypothetical protein
MLPDKYVTITMAYDRTSADLMAVFTNDVTGESLSKSWSTTEVATHKDNEWHTVRDLLVDFIGESF